MSFQFNRVKYYCPFYKDEEFLVKENYYSQNLTLLALLSSMFPRKMLGDNKELTESYWRKIIEKERRVECLLIFSDKVYTAYPELEKPSKQSESSFVIISKAETVVPRGLLPLFVPSGASPDETFLKGVRVKLRILRQHIHPRSIVIPYDPRIIFEDVNLIAINKPFGIPSIGESNDLANEWNSILTWTRQLHGKRCDFMNRLDLDVSGLVLLGKSGSYRKKRGFAKGFNNNKEITTEKKTVKVYLGIIPRQPLSEAVESLSKASTASGTIATGSMYPTQSLRITTPRLKFRHSKAMIAEQKQQQNNATSFCKTSIYKILDFNDGLHSLVAICLEESGQRHQIRYHLSLIKAPISNDKLYHEDKNVRRTGVTTSSVVQSAAPNENSSTCIDQSLVVVEAISQEESESFFKNYIYVNGVTEFRESSPVKSEEKLIRCTLYPLEKDFQNELKSKFDFCQYGYCGKCEKLKDQEGNSDEKNVTLEHGIYLHSWRYFNVSGNYTLLEAELNHKWWPVEILKKTAI